jgi:hypothetical protein
MILTSFVTLALWLGTPTAQPDVASPEGIVAAFLAAGSGPAGARDVARMRSLFSPNARITTVRRSPAPAVARMRTIDEYIAESESYWRDHASYERVVRSSVERQANFGHVLASFEAHATPTRTGEPSYRALASFQLLWDGQRWWITSAFWQGETPDAPLAANWRTAPE